RPSSARSLKNSAGWGMGSEGGAGGKTAEASCGTGSAECGIARQGLGECYAGWGGGGGAAGRGGGGKAGVRVGVRVVAKGFKRLRGRSEGIRGGSVCFWI